MIKENQQLVLDKNLSHLQRPRREQFPLSICWNLNPPLEQNHLQESIIDAKESVLNALETMFVDKMKT